MLSQKRKFQNCWIHSGKVDLVKKSLYTMLDFELGLWELGILVKNSPYIMLDFKLGLWELGILSEFFKNSTTVCLPNHDLKKTFLEKAI